MPVRLFLLSHDGNSQNSFLTSSAQNYRFMTHSSLLYAWTSFSCIALSIYFQHIYLYIYLRKSCAKCSLEMHIGVPIVAQWLTNPTGNHEVAGSIPGLAQWVKELALPWVVVKVADEAQILCFCGLWRRPGAPALIRPLAWEPPYAVGAAQEMAKRQKKKVWKF